MQVNNCNNKFESIRPESEYYWAEDSKDESKLRTATFHGLTVDAKCWKKNYLLFK